MTKVLESVNGFIWGIPVLIGIIGVGIFLSVRTGFAQFWLFPKALQAFFRQFTKNGAERKSSFRALCTALAATVGTGNIAGVAGAIALGGPGAVFWMWICALLGMVTKFAEAVLAVRYRGKTSDGEIVSGPMIMIQNGMGLSWNWLAYLYSFLGLVAAFGIGNAAQVNTLVSSINELACTYGSKCTNLGNLILGCALACLVLLVLGRGVGCVCSVAEILVPFASGVYLLLGVGVLIARFSVIPQAFYAILLGAYSPRAVTGGVLGSAFIALRIGASRGTFTNEAGMGTASIAHGAAQVNHPVEQGLMGIIEVFLDTIVICTLTALVILVSGISVPYGVDAGAVLTIDAFASVYGPWVRFVLVFAIACFSVATIFGWGFYGARCSQFLFGKKAWMGFVYSQCVAVIWGAMLNTRTVWVLSEMLNGLMAIPNLIMLISLSPELVRLVGDYKYYVR